MQMAWPAAMSMMFVGRTLLTIIIFSVTDFGGMMRCDDIAEGLVAAAREVGLSKPLVVRLEGTNVEKGREILRDSGLPMEPVESMGEAAKKIVEAVKEVT